MEVNGQEKHLLLASLPFDGESARVCLKCISSSFKEFLIGRDLLVHELPNDVEIACCDLTEQSPCPIGLIFFQNHASHRWLNPALSDSISLIPKIMEL